MPHGSHSERLAASVTDAVAAHDVGKAPNQRFGTLDRIELHEEGSGRHAVAVDQRVNCHLPQVRVSVPVDKAADRTVAQSSQDWVHRHMPHLHAASQPTPANEFEPTNHAWPASDPRNPDHPRHADFELLRGKVAAAYAHAGIARGRMQLDHATAAVMQHARQGCLDVGSTQVSLLADRTGVIGPDSDLLLQQECGALVLRTRIMSSELQTSPGQAFQPITQTVQQQGLPGHEAQQARTR
jgi:hypothetical protein